MQDLGFKAENSVDFSTFAILILLLVVLAGLSLYLKHRSGNGRVLGHSRAFPNPNLKAGYREQKLDKHTRLQEIYRGEVLYLVLQTETGAVLLDKIANSDSNEQVEKDHLKQVESGTSPL